VMERNQHHHRGTAARQGGKAGKSACNTHRSGLTLCKVRDQSPRKSLHRFAPKIFARAIGSPFALFGVFSGLQALAPSCTYLHQLAVKKKLRRSLTVCLCVSLRPPVKAAPVDLPVTLSRCEERLARV
jgi:hypothetical protein